MKFNEANSVRDFVRDVIRSDDIPFVPGGQLPRDKGQVLLESHVTDALIRLNPEIAAEPGRELAWAGHVPFLFAGRHGFVLTPKGRETHILHTEILGGLLARTWSRAKVARDFTPAYEAVNVALAARVAALH